MTVYRNLFSEVASEETLDDLRDRFAAFRTAFDAEDFATQATLEQVRAILDSEDFASESTLTQVRDKDVLTETQLRSAPVDIHIVTDDLGSHVGVENPLPVASRLTDENGVPFTPGNRLPVDIQGAEISGTFQTTPSVESDLNIPPGPLAANEVFVGGWEDVLQYSAIQIAVFTDQASVTNGASIEFSADGVNVLRAVPTTIPANFAAYFHLSPEARYVRFRYTNGPVAQTVLRLSVLFSYGTPSEVIQPLGSTITDANVGTVSRAALTTRMMSGASAGAYVPVGNDGTGRMLVSNGHTQPLTDTQLRAAPVVVDTELTAAGPLSTEATLEAVRVLLANEDFASQTTLATRASEATLEALRALVAAEDFSSEATLVQVRDHLDTVESLLTTTRDRNSVLTLTRRMFEKTPAEGYEIWMDTSNDALVIIAEAPAAQADENAAVWRGIRIPKVAGLVVGRVAERTGFAWTDRAVGW